MICAYVSLKATIYLLQHKLDSRLFVRVRLYFAGSSLNLVDWFSKMATKLKIYFGALMVVNIRF